MTVVMEQEPWVAARSCLEIARLLEAHIPLRESERREETMMDPGKLPAEASHAGLSPILHIHGHSQVSFLSVTQ